jgi:hypothetical protein
MAQVMEMAGLVPLAEVIAGAPAEHVLAPGFGVRLTGPLVGGDVADQAVATGTVGERTVVVQLQAGERRLARIPDLLVDPAELRWLPKGRPRGMWTGWRPGAEDEVSQELEEVRLAGDERARRDKDRRRREGEAEGRRSTSPGDRRGRASRCRGLKTGGGAREVLDGQDGSVQPPANPPMPGPGHPDGRGPEAAGATGDPVDDGRAQPLPALAAPGQRACDRCGRPLSGRNRSGVCGPCRSICPDCDGVKAPQAARCWRCAGQGRPGGPSPAAVDEPERTEGAAAEGEGTAVDAETVDLGTPDSPVAAEPSPLAGEGVAGPSEEAVAAGGPVKAELESEAVGGGGERSCGRCGVQLRGHNRNGVCMRCQSTCPTCGGAKAAQAERCRACRSEPPGLAVEALETAEAYVDLAELVRDLHEQYATLARYARELEDELTAYRAAERRRRREEQLTGQRGQS